MVPDAASSDLAAAPARKLDVLIVDDSLVVRRIIGKALTEHPAFNVVAAVANAEQALDFVARRAVDLIILDMQMPGQDGLEALPALIDGEQRTQVVLLSGACHEGSGLALRALSLGASDVLAKPSAGHFSAQFLTHLIDRLTHLMPATERSRTPEREDEVNARLREPGSQVRALGIGGSTGAIGAILSLVDGLDRNTPFPIFLTQHLPANFLSLFAEQLRRASRVPVVLADDGMAVEPGTIHLAPGRAHLSLRRTEQGQVCVRLTDERCLHGGFPAADPMFASMARVYRAGACGVILSGMGRDGLAGAQAIVAAGGWMIAQDHQSSAVWGMPGSVVRAGLASIIASPAEMAGLIHGHREAAA